MIYCNLNKVNSYTRPPFSSLSFFFKLKNTKISSAFLFGLVACAEKRGGGRGIYFILKYIKQNNKYKSH